MMNQSKLNAMQIARDIALCDGGIDDMHDCDNDELMHIIDDAMIDYINMRDDNASFDNILRELIIYRNDAIIEYNNLI